MKQKSLKIKKIAKKAGIVLIVLLLIPILWYGRYRFYKVQGYQDLPLMHPQNLEGYTDKQLYFIGDTIKLFVRAKANSNTATVERMTAFNESSALKSVSFGAIEQKLDNSQPEFGCNWQNPILIKLENSFEKGYYKISLKSEKGDTFNIYFLVASKQNSGKIAYLANVSTWTAYNYWGGKSQYRNILDDENVHYASTQRPNVAFVTEHEVEIEANGYHWLCKNYGNIDIYPDYILEKNPELLKNKKVIVLPFHSEYFSSEMYSNLEELIYDGRSLLALGANQIYWKIRWHDDYTRMEVRKDFTFFDDQFLEYGGMWRHRLRPQERFLGARYTQKGLHTHAPYKVTNAKHWLYSGLNVKNGDIFGEKGIDGKPISGVETDKIGFLSPSDYEPFAKGMNSVDYALSSNIYYPDKKANWNGEGGGDFGYRKLSDTNAILNSAAIQSVSGLGADEVFTTIVRNFLNRYFPNK